MKLLEFNRLGGGRVLINPLHFVMAQLDPHIADETTLVTVSNLATVSFLAVKESLEEVQKLVNQELKNLT